MKKIIHGLLSFLLVHSAWGVEPRADERLPVKTGLELWFDCSHENAERIPLGLPPLGPGNAVASLVDASGHGRHLFQLERDARPKFRQDLDGAFLSFDGTNDVLAASRLDTKMVSATIFLVAAPHSNAGEFRGFYSMSRAGQNDYASGMNFDFGPAGSAQINSLNVEGAGAGGIAQMLQGTSFPFGGWHVFSVESSPGPKRVQLAIDGKAPSTRERKDSEIRMDEFTLGARLYSNAGDPPYVQGFFHGDIAELLVYGRVLTDSEKNSVEQYLKTKYVRLLERSPQFEGEGKPLVTVTNPPPVQVFIPGFTVRQLPVSLKNINDLKYRSDGKLVALGYDGHISLLTDSDRDGLEDHVEPFWTNNTLRSPIGMALTPPGYARGQGIFVAAKGKLSLIVDTNGDDRADQEIIVAEGWKELSHGVDALGVAVDKEGNVFFGLGTANFTDAFLIDKTTGMSHYDLKSERGTIMKVSADFKHREIVCTGIRFPVAMAFNRENDLFSTDQEGATWLPNGNPFDELLHIQPGRHYGFPPRHPKYLPGVIDEPSVFDYMPQHQSTCGLNFNESVNGGLTFGPSWWAGDALVCGYSRGKIWRTKLVKTEAGYVAQTQLIASLPVLTVDACVSPHGDLVVSTHSGEPDWGSGPNGEGRLYKISYTGQTLPEPIAAWMPNPAEIDIAFDRPLDPATLKELIKRVQITQGKYVSAGDRFEVKRPGYAAVYSQLNMPRYDVPVQSASFTRDARTIILHTTTLSAAVNYGITISGFERASVKNENLPQYPDLDLVASLNGVQVGWQPEHPESSKETAWQGWLPHLGLDIAKTLTQGSADHEALWPKLQSPGLLTFRGQLDLWQMLQPAIQPGGTLDYERPLEQVTVTFTSSSAFKIRFGGASVNSEKSFDGSQQVVLKHPGEHQWVPFEITMPTGETAPGLTATWSTSDDSRPRAFPLRRFLMPWAKADSSPSLAENDELPKELAGGDWANGKRLFFGEIAACFKCHLVRGEGNSVGPDLSNLVQRDYASVLNDIRFPNAALNPDHLAYIVEMTDGEDVTGVLQADTPEVITIADASGRKTIPKSRIKSIKASGLSLMPEGLDKVLAAGQLKDLLTFLLVAPLKPAQLHIPDAPAPRKPSEVEAILGPSARDQSSSGKPMKILLCSGPKDHGTDEHDYPLWQQRWARLLGLADNVVVTTASGWPSSEAMRLADVIVFYSDNPGWSQVKAPELEEFQRRGGGLVYIHFAVDGHEAFQALSDRIGLAWHGGQAKFRHGQLDLKFQGSNPISRGFTELDLHDESYWQLTGDPASINILATNIEDGKPQPLIWTKENGPGRVFVSIPGHFTWTFDDPLFRILLLRGICWVAHQPEDRLSALATIGARLDDGHALNKTTAYEQR